MFNAKPIFSRGRAVMLLLAASVPSMALAHAGHSGDAAHSTLYDGFVHPFTGLDHLLMMLAVGLWAGRAGGALRWQLPAAFLSGMAGGWLLGGAGLVMPGLESGIAATLIALGVAMALPLQPKRGQQLGAVAAFAMLHGLAHRGELQGGAAAGLGMLAATALLHAAGVIAAARLLRGTAYRTAGAGLALVGGALLF